MRPHREIVSGGKSIAPLCAVLGILLVPGGGMAQNITMQDGGSTAIINPGNGSGDLGMNNWSVDTINQNQLNEQWFWYSVASVNGGVAQSIDTIGGLNVQNNNYGSEGLNEVTLTYANALLSVNVEYTLSGGGDGSGSADLTESIWIDNNSASSLTLNFYQYSNFNLLQNNNNRVNISGSAGAYTGAMQTTGGPGGSGIAEVIQEPNATYAEANYANAGINSTLYKLNNTANLTLDDNTSAGMGNVTWAFQWTTTILPGGEFDIYKDKGLSITAVPEPSTVTFVALGLGALGLAFRRRLS